MDILTTNDSSIILNPTIVKVGNCNFRSYKDVSQPETKSTLPTQLEPYLDNDEEMVNCAEYDDDLEITLTKAGKFITEFHVASAFYGNIIGMKGNRKREIEMSTDTSIKIPKHGETGKIVITGPTERSVASAWSRVNMIVLQNRDNKQITHFVSIPVVSEEIWKNFDDFKQKIVSGPPLRGVDETVFQTPGKLHLTIAPLVLLDDKEIEIAVEALHNYKNTLSELFLNSGPIKIVLEGLEIMNDDPTAVDVLYGKVKLNLTKYNTQFQRMADNIVQLLSKKGLMRKQYDNVKLHVTLMNSMFRKRAQESNTRESFDASYILQKFKNFYFGEAEFKEVSLVIRFTVAEDKFYERLTTITL